jgi:hypothetical protein
MNPMMRKIAALVLTALLAAGCSGAGATGASSTPSPTPSPSKDIRYNTVVELRDAVVAAGYRCPNWQPNTGDDGPKYAKESGTCTEEDVFSIYTSDTDVDNQVDLSVGLIEMLVGPNWILNLGEGQAGQANRERVQAAIGGKIVAEGTLDPDEPNSESSYSPKRSDFALKVKIRDKECFGSAGCLVEIRIEPSYVGTDDLPESGTIELTYKVTGDEDGPVIGTIELELPDGDYYREEKSIQTRSSGTKITAKVTEVSYNQ